MEYLFFARFCVYGSQWYGFLSKLVEVFPVSRVYIDASESGSRQIQHGVVGIQTPAPCVSIGSIVHINQKLVARIANEEMNEVW